MSLPLRLSSQLSDSGTRTMRNLATMHACDYSSAEYATNRAFRIKYSAAHDKWQERTRAALKGKKPKIRLTIYKKR